MKIRFALLTVLLLLVGCREKDSLIGQWVQPIEGTQNQIQGMMLTEDGEARSINMNTLLYDKWQRKGNLLILSGKSIGNGQTIEFEETYVFRQPDKNTLVLQTNGTQEQTYRRKD